MRKISIGILAATFGFLSAAAPAAASGHCDGGSIKVGIVKSLTGDFSFFDNAGAQGEMLALEIADQQGGIDGCPVEVIMGDLKSDPSLARQTAKDVIAKGAQILFVPGDFDFGIGASQAAAEAGILAMSAESASVDWPTAAGGRFFVGGTTNEDLGVGQAVFAGDKGWDTAYVVTNEALTFFIDLERVFAANFNGVILGRDVVAMGQPDYSAVISNIRNAGEVDVIVGNDFFPFVGTFIKQLRDAGVDTPVLGNSTYSSQALPELVGRDRVQEIYYVSQSFYEGANPDPATADFVARYQTRFEVFPENVNAVLGYWGGLLIVNALRKAGSADADALANALDAQSGFGLPGAVLLRWVDRTTKRRSRWSVSTRPAGSSRSIASTRERGDPPGPDLARVSDFPILRTERLTKNFGGIGALSDVSIEVAAGRVLGLIGPNGAGKTTLVNCVSGVLPPSAGQVYLGETDITCWPRHRRARAGLLRTYQNLRLFPELTVAENVEAGLVAHGRASLRARSARVRRTLEAQGLGHLQRTTAGSLSYGLQRRVEIARSLIGRPRVLLLDEPSAGLGREETTALRELLLAAQRDVGFAIVIIAHDVSLIMDLSHRVAVLHEGRLIFSGTPTQVAKEPAVLDAYFSTPTSGHGAG